MKVKLTKRSVDALTTGADRYVVWDRETRGFGIRVNLDGSKTFVLKYFVNGRQRWLSIGKFGALTIDQARKQALQALGDAARGEDAVENRKHARMEAKAKSLTLEDFCASYLTDAAAGRVTYRGRAKKTSTLYLDEGRIRRHIIPLLGHKRIGDIASEDVEAFRHAVRQGKTATTVKTGPRGVARVRGGETASNRALGLLGSIMSHAVKLKLRTDNPVRGIERFQDRKRQRAILPDEYLALGQALDMMQVDGANPWAVSAYRVLVLTGCRRAEILGLRKAEVDHHHHCLRFGDTKSGQQVRAVGSVALEVLASVPKVAESDFVFPASRGSGHLRDVKQFHRACEMAGLEDITLHTLRHGFASVAGELGYADATIGVLLGHVSNTISGRYTHIPDPAALAAADRVSATIARRMSGEA